MIDAVASPAEEQIRSKLAELGWSLDRTTEQSTDFEIAGKTDDGRPYRIRGMSGFTAMAGVSNPIGDPQFFRIEIGAVSRNPTCWGLWSTTYNALAPGASGGEVVGTFVYQAVADGAGAAVFVGAEMRGSGMADPAVVCRAVMIGVRECRNLRRPGIEPNRTAIEPWRSPAAFAIDGTSRIRIWLPVGIAVTLLVGTIAILTRAVPLGLLSMGIALVTIGYIVIGASKRTPHPSVLIPASELQRALRSSEVPQVEPEFRVIRDLHCPVVVKGGGGRDVGRARFGAVAWQHYHAEHDLRARVWVWSIEWPQGALPEHQLLPASWAVIEWTGSNKALEALPSWDRKTQEPGSVRWLLREDELGAAPFAQACAQLARRLRLGRDGIYR